VIFTRNRCLTDSLNSVFLKQLMKLWISACSADWMEEDLNEINRSVIEKHIPVVILGTTLQNQRLFNVFLQFH
jgi:hypothetical protein